LTEVGCAEDIGVGNYLSDTCVGGLTVGATYYVQMGSWADGCPNGPYNLTFAAAGTCGNGTVECGEQCDDGNTLGGDCCSATCQNETICGNGCVEFPEACDDGNVTSGDGCSATCELEQFCGDNLVNQPSEECDGLGAPLCAPGLHCTPSCKCVGGGVPAVSEWGLAVLTLIGLVSGTILFGRRRVAVR